MREKKKAQKKVFVFSFCDFIQKGIEKRQISYFTKLVNLLQSRDIQRCLICKLLSL